jgi:hypothetical protein
VSRTDFLSVPVESIDPDLHHVGMASRRWEHRDFCLVKYPTPRTQVAPSEPYAPITASTPKRLRIQAKEDARNAEIRAEVRQSRETDIPSRRRVGGTIGSLHNID